MARDQIYTVFRHGALGVSHNCTYRIVMLRMWTLSQ